MARSAAGAKHFVVRDPKIHSGEPVFAGTRVPVRILLDYLEGGDGLDAFLEQYPGVRREQADAAIRFMRAAAPLRVNVLLDADPSRQPKRELVGRRVTTVTELGWGSVPDGDLLSPAGRNGFTVLLTGDRNLPFQQPVANAAVAVVVLAMPNNRLATVRALVPAILAALAQPLRPGSGTTVGRWRVH